MGCDGWLDESEAVGYARYLRSVSVPTGRTLFQDDRKEGGDMRCLKEQEDKDLTLQIDGAFVDVNEWTKEGEGDYVQSYPVSIHCEGSLMDIVNEISKLGYSDNIEDYNIMHSDTDSSIETNGYQDADGYSIDGDDVEKYLDKGEKVFIADIQCGIKVISDSHVVTDAEAKMLSDKYGIVDF